MALFSLRFSACAPHLIARCGNRCSVLVRELVHGLVERVAEAAARADVDRVLGAVEEAADVMASADALLVVMSFEKEHELFMRTSFTTKFLDYVAFGKPVILWGPEYCTPVRVARKHGGAVVVNQDDADAIVSACRQIAHDAAWREQLSQQARQLHQTLFDPDRLQEIFVSEIEKLVRSRGPRN